jgi:hypothetical protein
VTRIEVYGPGSRAALVKASSGPPVTVTPSQRKARFYLFVLHGRFVGPSQPAGKKAPQRKIETQVWTPTGGVTDLGISDRVPHGVTRLHRLAVVRLG